MVFVVWLIVKPKRSSKIDKTQPTRQEPILTIQVPRTEQDYTSAQPNIDTDAAPIPPILRHQRLEKKLAGNPKRKNKAKNQN